MAIRYVNNGFDLEKEVRELYLMNKQFANGSVEVIRVSVEYAAKNKKEFMNPKIDRYSISFKDTYGQMVDDCISIIQSYNERGMRLATWGTGIDDGVGVIELKEIGGN